MAKRKKLRADGSDPPPKLPPDTDPPPTPAPE